MNGIERKNFLTDIDRWRKMYEKRVAKDPVGCRALYKLLDDFWIFCNEYVDYTEENLMKLAEATNTTEVYVRHHVDNILLNEWDLLVRIMEQRELQRYWTFLRTANERSLDYLPGPAPPMVSYLGRISVIRQHVYSSVSIAGIPRDQYPVGDGMALPHEAGHHIWHLTSADNGFEKTFVQAVKSVTGELSASKQIGIMLVSWREEIYADVYGAYVAGADYAFSLIDMLKRRIGNEDDLFTDDGQHAFAYLRPLIRAKVLASRGLEDESVQVRAQWTAFVKEVSADIKSESMLKPKDDSGGAKLPLAELQQALDQIIDKTILPQIDAVFNRTDFPVEAFTFGAYRLRIEERLNAEGEQTLAKILAALSRSSGANPLFDPGTGGSLPPYPVIYQVNGTV